MIKKINFKILYLKYLENGPVGVYNFSVNVVGKGLAKMNANTNFEFDLTATDFNPKSSGVGGKN